MVLIRIFMLCPLLSLGGCFYLVPEGKGGVAERFPIPERPFTLSERIDRSETVLTELQLQSSRGSYPALYREVEMQLIESRRLLNAEFNQQAVLVLEPVEQLLYLMQQGFHLRAASQLCHQKPSQEVCL